MHLRFNSLLSDQVYDIHDDKLNSAFQLQVPKCRVLLNFLTFWLVLLICSNVDVLVGRRSTLFFYKNVEAERSYFLGNFSLKKFIRCS